MLLNGFGKYIDVDELWPNKNSYSAFPSTFTTAENTGWQCPTAGVWQSSHCHRFCPSPSAQVTFSYKRPVPLPTSLAASIGTLNSVLNVSPWGETDGDTFLPGYRASVLTLRKCRWHVCLLMSLVYFMLFQYIPQTQILHMYICMCLCAHTYT